jgi:hypothetical protein
VACWRKEGASHASRTEVQLLQLVLIKDFVHDPFFAVLELPRVFVM